MKFREQPAWGVEETSDNPGASLAKILLCDTIGVRLLSPIAQEVLMQIHSIEDIHPSRPVIEGAGVKLRRAFGFDTLPLYDPFLLLDDFRSNNPEDYIKGFPWHPHRGIETIT